MYSFILSLTSPEIQVMPTPSTFSKTQCALVSWMGITDLGSPLRSNDHDYSNSMFYAQKFGSYSGLLG